MDNTSSFDKYDLKKIPENIGDYVSSFETVKLLHRIAFTRYGVPAEISKKIIEIVWEIYFKRLSFDKLESELLGTGLDNSKAKTVSEALKKEIFGPISDYLGAAGVPNIQNNDLVKISLISAMQKYPALGEKLITSNPIKLKIFPAQVRPSIKNWIADYHQVVGAGTHGSVERANYLYHGDNTKNLNQVERQKLAVVLKSIDENEPVTIDTEKMQIIFSGQAQSSPTAVPSENERKDEDKMPQRSFSSSQDYFKRNAKPDEDKNVQFSYPQKMSSETLVPKRVFPPENPSRLPQKPAQPEDYNPRTVNHLSEGNGNTAGRNNSEPEPKVQGNVVDLRG